MAVNELSWRKFAINSLLDIVDRFEHPVYNSYKRDRDEAFSGSSLRDIEGYCLRRDRKIRLLMSDYHKAKLERALTLVAKVLDGKDLSFHKGFRHHVCELEFDGIYDTTQDYDNIVASYLNLDSVEIGFEDLFFEFSLLCGKYEVKFILTRDILEYFGCRAIATYILQLYYTEKAEIALDDL